MKNKEILLICKRIIYYVQNDEDAFFEWIKKINCITKFTGAGDELYLHIASKNISAQNLYELIGLFYRYKTDMKQLQIFLNAKNKAWFHNKKMYWYRRVFGVDRK